jgi:hypothetical protein
MLEASMLSVTEPIWLTLRRRALHIFWSIAVWTRVGLVTRRSSPTTWQAYPIRSVIAV